MPDVYKIVNATQLDSDLTSVANAIRTKGGTSAQLAFPSEFITAIADIITSRVYEEAIVVPPSTSAQTVTIPQGYDAVNNVTVSAIQIDSSNNRATSNGTYTPSVGSYFSSFTVAIPTYDGSAE